MEGTGIRGAAELADPALDDGFVRCNKASGDASRTVEYVVTGSAVSANDYSYDTGSGSRHGGVDLVLSVNGLLIQAQVDGWARDLKGGSRLSVRGELTVIAYYEWDSCDLVDTRGSWSVEETLRLPGLGGDFMLRLLPAPAFPGS